MLSTCRLLFLELWCRWSFFYTFVLYTYSPVISSNHNCFPREKYRILEASFFSFSQYDYLLDNTFFSPDESYRIIFMMCFVQQNDRLVLHILQNVEYSMIIRGSSPNSLWKILCSLRYGATQWHTHIHIHTSNERFTHTCHTCYTHTFECLLNICHTYTSNNLNTFESKKPALSSSWLGSCTFFFWAKKISLFY